MYSKEYHLAYQRRRYAERLAEAIERLGGKCSVCGSVEGLEFHHRDPETKVMAVTTMLSKYSMARINAELAKCVLLCKTHHQVETTLQKAVPHGGGLSGKKNCPCDLCRPVKNAYMVDWHKRLRSSAG